MRRLEEVAELFGDSLARKQVALSKHLIPPDWFAGTRAYLEQMVYQINVAYEYELHDACAVLLRRLMESLIIEVYVYDRRQREIQNGGVFFMLERLIAHMKSDPQVTLSRNAPRTMREVKQLGDTAAHDRTYITPQVDIDDLKARYRRLIHELVSKTGIGP